tara:strand:- start:14939 stop:16777 length:1839 start_codon:yes stop_codon:yes gene_type:complete
MAYAFTLNKNISNKYMSGYTYYMGSSDVYVEDTNDGNGAFLNTLNTATSNNHVVNKSYVDGLVMDVQRQIQYFGGIPNAYWVTGNTTASDLGLEPEVTYSDGTDTISRTFYSTIDAAITAAAASSNSDTYTAYIYIQAGTYTSSSSSSITINTLTGTGANFNVVFIGEGNTGDVIIDMNDSEYGFLSDTIDYTSTSSIGFQNITFQNASKYALKLAGSNITIKDCVFKNCGYLNSLTMQESASTLSTNYNGTNGIQEGGAIYIDGGGWSGETLITSVSTGSTITNSGECVIITNCQFEYTASAIYIDRGFYGNISKCTFKDSGKTPIYLKDSYRSVVQNNVIYSSYASGIMFCGCFRCNILDNSIYNTWNSAICLEYSPHTVVQNNIMNFVNSRSYNGVGWYPTYSGSADYTSADNYKSYADASIVIRGENDIYVQYWIIILDNNGPGRSTLARVTAEPENENSNFTSTNADAPESEPEAYFEQAPGTSLGGVNNSNACLFMNNTLNRGGGGSQTGYSNAHVQGLYIETNVDLPVIIHNFVAVQPFYISNSLTFTNWNNYQYEQEPGYAIMIKNDSTQATMVYNSCSSFGYNVDSETTNNAVGFNLQVEQSS